MCAAKVSRDPCTILIIAIREKRALLGTSYLVSSHSTLMCAVSRLVLNGPQSGNSTLECGWAGAVVGGRKETAGTQQIQNGNANQQECRFMVTMPKDLAAIRRLCAVH